MNNILMHVLKLNINIVKKM